MLHSSIAVRRIVGISVSLALASAGLPGCAQREPAANKTVVTAANTIVSTMNLLSCSRFVGMVESMTPIGGSASPSPSASPGRIARMGSRIAGIAVAPLLNVVKNNPQARAEFVNIVAGPLVNKMVDCNMLPGGT